MKEHLGRQQQAAARMTEVDMFSVSGSGPATQHSKLRSPVKTNPLTEAERPSKPAVYIAQTAEYCPSLIRSSTSRVVTGEEAQQIRRNLGVKVNWDTILTLYTMKYFDRSGRPSWLAWRGLT